MNDLCVRHTINQCFFLFFNQGGLGGWLFFFVFFQGTATYLQYIQSSAQLKLSKISNFSTKINLVLLNFLFEIFGNLVEKMSFHLTLALLHKVPTCRSDLLLLSQVVHSLPPLKQCPKLLRQNHQVYRAVFCFQARMFLITVLGDCSCKSYSLLSAESALCYIQTVGGMKVQIFAILHFTLTSS